MPNLKRTTESELYPAVISYLTDAGGEATISSIRRAIPRYVSLSPADRQPSPTRPGEELWEQLVRNIVCHRFCEGNPIKEGRLRYFRRRLMVVNGPQRDLFDNDNG